MVFQEQVEDYKVLYTLNSDDQVVFLDGCTHKGQPVDLKKDRYSEIIYEEIMERLGLS